MSQPVERLTVESFAGIKHLRLDVQPFTVIIGPQSVGKSVTAKLLYFFQMIPRMLIAFAEPPDHTSIPKKLAEQFTSFFPEPTQGNQKRVLHYARGPASIRLEHPSTEKGEWQAHLPKSLTEAAIAYHRELVGIDWLSGVDDPKASNRLLLKFNKASQEYWAAAEELFPRSGWLCRFIPAGRSFYAQVESDAVSFFENASLDPFMAEFGKYLARSRRTHRTVVNQRPAGVMAATIVESLISGRLLREGKADFIHTTDGRKLPAKSWSSGQQEAYPLAFTLQQHCDGIGALNTLFAEEPEAHLFPKAQKIMTELIALAFNGGRSPAKVFLTTHSPYLLTTINNLLLAGRLYHAEPNGKRMKELQKVLPKERALVPGQVGVFYMDQEGCRSIMDPETGLVGASAIDEVSDVLNDQFDTLLNLQPEMPIPDECFEERGHVGGRLVCTERGKKLTFLKPRERPADKIRVDGCFPLPGLACDYLVIDWLGRKHFVELKGKDVQHALKQLENTIPHFVTRGSTEKIWCFIVCACSPPNSLPGIQNRKARLRNICSNVELVVKSINHEHRLTE